MVPRPRRSLILKILLVLALCAPSSGVPAAESRIRQKVLESVETQRDDLVRLSEQIWAWAEIALRETRSAAAVADYAERHGFKVERGVAGLPTAFIASFGTGRPIIGVLGEYDALPGISQKAQATQEPLQAGGAGHGCGHNLFGPASLGAALAIKDRIAAGDLKGTIRFYGTPAEEALGGKIYMARAGLFQDLDVALAWHPEDRTKADVDSTQAMVVWLMASMAWPTVSAGTLQTDWSSSTRILGSFEVKTREIPEMVYRPESAQAERENSARPPALCVVRWLIQPGPAQPRRPAPGCPDSVEPRYREPVPPAPETPWR